MSISAGATPLSAAPPLWRGGASAPSAGDGGRAESVQTLDGGRAFDDQGHFNPELIQGTERNWSCDSVIVAIGQMGELSWLRPEDGLHTTPRGSLQGNTTP